MEKLTQFLAAKSLSQSEFARLLGVSQVSVHYFVTGKKRPSVLTAAAIERVTGGAVPASAWGEKLHRRADARE